MSVSDRGVTILVDETYIYGKDLENVNNIEEFDLSFSTLPIGTCDFNLSIKNEYYELFTVNKAFEVYFNGNSYGKYFVSETERIDNDKWVIRGVNWIYFLEYEYLTENLVFPPDFPTSNVYNIYDTVFSYSSVPITIDESFKNIPAYAYIKKGQSIKTALSKMNLAYNAICSNEFDGLKISPNSMREDITEIPSERIMEGSRIEENSERVKTLELQSVLSFDTSGDPYYDSWPHMTLPDYSYIIYVNDEDIGKEYTVYSNNTYPRVKYGVLNYGITANPKDYEIVDCSPTHVVIKFRLSGRWQVRGKVFSENLLIKNNYIFEDNNVLSNKNASVDGAEFITELNVEEVGNRLLTAQNNAQKFRCRIVEGKHVKEGELFKYGEKKYGQGKYGERRASEITYDSKIEIGGKYAVDMQKYGVHLKTVEKMSYNLNGNIIIKDCVLR